MIRSSKNRLAFIASLKLDDVSQIRVNALWTKYETGIRTSVRKNGPHYALDRYKSCYIFLRNKMLKLPTLPIPFCKVDELGIPKPLWTLRPLIKGDRSDQRIALTIARSYELIKLPIDYSTESIEEPSLEGMDFQETRQQFKRFLTEFSLKYPWYLGSLQKRDSFEPQVFTTLSKGPNGPAVATSHLDAKAVVEEPNLFNAIRDLNNVLGQSWITKWLVNQANSFTSSEKYLTGRLGFSAEPGGKTRIFAIADYWSQTSLKVIQLSLYRTLRSISTDSTDNQDKGFKTLLKESEGKDTYCFDLTAASDRIPAEMQKDRLELLGGQALGDAWHKVMTDRTFLIKAKRRSVRWAVGQPLGLLSSFPSFALWHHDIVQFAHYRCRMREDKNPIKFFKDYRLLGDDVVIFNKKVSMEYQFLMTEVFGIPINLQKSVIGDSSNSQIEFTKRLALRGKEMSSIKRNILSKSSIQSMLELVDILIERDFISPDTGHYGLYPFLGQEEQTQFRFMFWVRSHTSLPFKGDNGVFEISRESFNQRLKEKRAQNLMEKTALIDKYLNEAKPLNEYYRKSSLPCSDKALGLSESEGFPHDNLMLHPLVWAINQTGLDLSIALSTIWDDESPDVAPVEYLPIVSSKSYFQTPRKGAREFLSKVILDVYTELSNELKTV